jgi:hypothetical protein
MTGGCAPLGDSDIKIGRLMRFNLISFFRKRSPIFTDIRIGKKSPFENKLKK